MGLIEAKRRMTDNESQHLSRPSSDKLPQEDDVPYTAAAIHMVRTSTAANLTLSQMADQKASILMGAQFVVFTVAIGQSGSGHYPLSLLCLALSAFVSAMFAIGTLVPTISAKPLPGQEPNILFFSVFSQMEEEEFIDRMLHTAENDRSILTTMLRDIHQNGVVLRRKKYRHLKNAYRVFQAGLCLTVLVFIYESRADLALLFT